MLPLETKQSGGKLLPHSDLPGGVFLQEVSCSRKRDILLGTWNVRSLYRAYSLTAAARELARYKLDLTGVQEVRWDKGATVRAGDYNFFYGKGNENHQLGTGFFVHQSDVNILGGRLDTVKKNAEALVAATKETGLEVNAHEIKYMIVSRDQNAGRIHSMKIDNSSIERVEEFNYLGITLTNQNSIQEEIKSSLK